MNDDVLMAALDGIHEWSMSKEEHKATTGRCLKRFFEQFDAFEKEECARGLHRGVVLFGMIHTMAVIAAITTLSGVKKGREEKVLTNTIELFSEVMRDVYDATINKRMDWRNT